MRAAAWIFLAGLGLNAHAADGFSAAGLYAGGGVGSRDVNDESRTVLQLYLGADLVRFGPADLGVEFGYGDTSEAEEDGYWVGGLAAFILTPDVRALVRAGADFGDEPGDHLGAGLGYRIEDNMEARFEIWSFDGDEVMLFSVAYHPFRQPAP